MTALILTANEEANIGRTLDRLRWLSKVVVLDSGSTDRTQEIVASFPNARLIVRTFDDFTSQWTYGMMECGIDTEWVLTLDADYDLSEELIGELQQLQPEPGVNGWEASFIYAISGHRLRGSLYPPRIVLFRRQATSHVQDGHTQTARVEGSVRRLRGRIVHDDRKPASRWLQSQSRYMIEEADKLLAADHAPFNLADRLRILLLAPVAVFFYTLIGKGCILDGWPGLCYTMERTIAECILALELVRRKLSP